MANEQVIVTLILGGARSGKSSYARQLAERRWPHPLFLACAETLDDEMRTRVARHQQERGARWRTVEEPLEVARLLAGEIPECDGVLWDCATIWLSNVLLKEGEGALAERQARVLEALRAPQRPVIVVSNEVGLGLVPPYPLGRQFRDAAGIFNQQLAALAERVVLLVAGLPLMLKENHAPEPSA
jgi:adenosylcobinamide kinase/adenosylcobinamide-phosphate guanylyltransferase